MTNLPLSPEDAFRAMVAFLSTCYARGGNKGDLGAVLSDIQIVSDDGRPADPAAWDDGMSGVRTVLAQRP